MYGMSASNMHKQNYSLSRIPIVVCSCFLSAIFHLLSDLVTSTGFQLITEYSSKLLHLHNKTLVNGQPSYLYNLVQVHQNSHHELSALQDSNFSN